VVLGRGGCGSDVEGWWKKFKIYLEKQQIFSGNSTSRKFRKNPEISSLPKTLKLTPANHLRTAQNRHQHHKKK
jgi:hypothetical protein